MPAKGRDHRLLEGDRTAGDPGRQWQRRGYFPPRAAERRLTLFVVDGALCIAKQNSRASAILRWRCGPPLPLRVLARPARRLSDRHEGRDGRGRSGKRT